MTVCGFSIFQHLVFGFRPKYKRFFGSRIRCGFRVFLFGFRFLFGNNFVPQPGVRENKFDESSDEDVDISTDDNISQFQQDELGTYTNLLFAVRSRYGRAVRPCTKK